MVCRSDEERSRSEIKVSANNRIQSFHRRSCPSRNISEKHLQIFKLWTLFLKLKRDSLKIRVRKWKFLMIGVIFNFRSVVFSMSKFDGFLYFSVFKNSISTRANWTPNALAVKIHRLEPSPLVVMLTRTHLQGCKYAPLDVQNWNKQRFNTVPSIWWQRETIQCPRYLRWRISCRRTFERNSRPGLKCLLNETVEQNGRRVYRKSNKWKLKFEKNSFRMLKVNSPPNCSSADAWNVSLSWRRTTHWYIPLSSRLTLDMISVSPNRADCGNCLPSLYHVMCCKPVDMPLLVITHRNSAVPPICTLNTFGTMSTCSGDVIVSLNSALASPPAFDAEHLYVPASSAVTASIANTGPRRRTRGPLMTENDSMPVFKNHLKWEETKRKMKTNGNVETGQKGRKRFVSKSISNLLTLFAWRRRY